MCGILAILPRERPLDSALLVEANARLGHRGPDGASHWIAPHGRVALAQTRLSIIDLSTFPSPIANEDDTIRVIVNGEFYDFERLRLELEQRGHRFRTRCDSEIVLHLYEEFGEACVEHLRGEFAFVLWDEKKNCLFAARDRFGIKPLFYAQTPAALFIASEPSALFAAGVPAVWDSESVFQNLFLCLEQDRSLFQGVRQVPPGHLLAAKQGAVRLRAYWDLDYPSAAYNRRRRSSSLPEAIEELQHHLRESVRIRLRSDVAVGCYLSGGLDSSSVLGLASSLSAQPLTAFTVAFDHPDFDESAVARDTAARIGVPFIAIPVSEADVADYFVEAVGAGDMVHYNGHGAARYLLSRAVRQAGYKAVLGGEGADELFAGYDFAQTALQRSIHHAGLLSRWMPILRALLGPRTASDRLISATSPWLGRICRAVGLAPSMLDAVAGKLSLVRGLLAPDFSRKFQNRDPYREFISRLDPRRTLRGRAPVHQLLYVWMKSLFPNYVLAGERLDMAHAVEVRLPFLDHKLFEFARNIPPQLLLKDGQRKYLLREAMKPFITSSVCGCKTSVLCASLWLSAGEPASRPSTRAAP
jgi:asparagine synthase (glutamine-hydrolysing)